MSSTQWISSYELVKRDTVKVFLRNEVIFANISSELEDYIRYNWFVLNSKQPNMIYFVLNCFIYVKVN
jgi:hypothetical protein